MIKDNQKRLNQLHVALDMLLVAAAYVLSWFVFFRSGLFSNETGGFLEISIESHRPSSYFTILIFIIPLYLVLNVFFKLYTPKRVQGKYKEFVNILKVNAMGILILSLSFWLLNDKTIDFSGTMPAKDLPRRMLFIFSVINVVLQTLERNLIRLLLRYLRAKGYNQKHILLIGYSDAAKGYIDRAISNPEWGYKIRGILDDNKERGLEYKGIKVIGHIDNLEIILTQNTLDEIAITLRLDEYDKLKRIVSKCEKSGVHTKFIPDYNNIVPTSPYMEDLHGLPVIHIRRVPLNNTFNFVSKRIIDIIGGVIGLIIFSPVMILTALAVKCSSAGPVIYNQERVGLHNKPFKMYKFRSMVVQSDKSEQKAWTTKDDMRVTAFGKFIRRTSIDELPQIINIIKGDMSIVGPRPERPFFVEKFKEEIPRYMIKHQVRPGLTGWAQVNGYRGDTSITKRIEHDLYYIENWSIGFDIKIIFLTIFKGFINKNAY